MSEMYNDLKRAADLLDTFAEIAKTSNMCAGKWPYESDKIEYDELRRLARRLRRMMATPRAQRQTLPKGTQQ